MPQKPLPPAAPAAPPSAGAAQAMLLLVFRDAGGRWCARVVDAAGARHEFLSPFELARWSAAAGDPPPAAGAGLR